MTASPQRPAVAYKRGDRVRHAKYRPGTVTGCHGDYVMVQFDGDTGSVARFPENLVHLEPAPLRAAAGDGREVGDYLMLNTSLPVEHVVEAQAVAATIFATHLAENEALKAEITRLRAALGPLAAEADLLDRQTAFHRPDERWIYVRLGDLRRAASTLAAIKGAGNG